jgi:uncharacterized protein (DUF305 family)
MRGSNWQRVLGCAVLALTVLAATGCRDSGAKSQASQTSQNQLTAQDEYLRDMIPHHQGALEWARLVLERGEHPELKEMAAATLKGSTTDIEQMERLLGPGKSANAHSHGGDHFGPAGIARIRQGVITDKVLLDWMIDHHQVGTDPGHAVLPMVENPEIKALVESMNNRLDGGLVKMKTWRAEWYGA